MDRFADGGCFEENDSVELICAQSRRLDLFVAEETGCSRSRAAAMIEAGLVSVNGKAQKKNYPVKAGERVGIVSIPEQACDALPEPIPLDIVYEDADLLVVNKEQGMVVHPAAGNPRGTLVNALLYHCGNGLSGINGVLRPGIVHRIDKNTSGLLAVAKTEAAHIGLALQLKEHSFDRVYRAVAHGTPKEEAGVIRFPIGRCRSDRKRMAVFPYGGRDAGVRHAVTHYRVLEDLGKYSHLECRLETGRTHQIRVHLKALGHPIVGDPVYCPEKWESFGLKGQCLHAKTIGFTHPITKERLFFDSALPDYFTKTLLKIKEKNR